jgi:hypothetical protein
VPVRHGRWMWHHCRPGTTPSWQRRLENCAKLQYNTHGKMGNRSSYNYCTAEFSVRLRGRGWTTKTHLAPVPKRGSQGTAPSLPAKLALRRTVIQTPAIHRGCRSLHVKRNWVRLSAPTSHLHFTHSAGAVSDSHSLSSPHACSVDQRGIGVLHFILPVE